MNANPPNREERTGPRIGITGGLACGKSTVGGLLEEAGWAVRDADDVAHDCMRPGGPVYRDLVEYFGRDILDGDEKVDRGVLGRRVFADARERQALNRIVHPPVLRRCRQWREAQSLRGVPSAVIIPLLFETGETGGWDAVVCVTAEKAAAMERLARRGLNRKDAEARWNAQMPLEEKVKRSDIVIENNGSVEELRMRVEQALRPFCNHGEKEHGRIQEQ